MIKRFRLITTAVSFVVFSSLSLLFVLPAEAATPPAIVSAPVTGTTYDEVPINITLPQAPLSGSLSLIFTGPTSDTISLNTTLGTGPYTFWLNPKNIASAGSIITSASSNTLSDGTYTVTVAYQDASADPPSSTIVTNVIINTTASGIAITGLTPINGAASVSINPTLTIAFNQPMVLGSGNVVIHKTSDGSIVQSIGITSTMVTASTDKMTYTITPSVALAYNTGYYVTVDASALQNQTGSAYGGINTATAWTFTTTTAPVTQSTATTSQTKTTTAAPDTGYGEPASTLPLLIVLTISLSMLGLGVVTLRAHREHTLHG